MFDFGGIGAVETVQKHSGLCECGTVTGMWNRLCSVYLHVWRAFAGSTVCIFVGLIEQLALFVCRKRKVSRFLTNVYVSLLISLLSLPAAAGVIPVLHDKVVIGAIMPLVPGIALTTSIRDFYNGDYLSGTIHLIDALLTALCIAVGIALPILLLRYGGNLPV